MNKWNVELQKYELKYKDMVIHSNCPMEVKAPELMVNTCHPAEPVRVMQVRKFGKPFQNMIRPNQDKFNTGIGVQQRHVKEKLRTIEGETGKKMEEIGNDQPNITRNTKEYKVTRNEVDHIRNTVQ